MRIQSFAPGEYSSLAMPYDSGEDNYDDDDNDDKNYVTITLYYKDVIPVTT